MLYKKLSGIVAGLFLLCGVASAQTDPTDPTGFYLRSNAFVANVAFESGVVPDHNPTGIYLTLGNLINENIAAEFRLGIGTYGDPSHIAGLEVKVEDFIGAYIRAGSLAGTPVNPYIVAGYTRGTVSLDLNGDSTELSGSDFSFGVGVDIAITEKTSLNIEYMKYYEDDGIEVTGWGLGGMTKF